ncbi:MAG TPA: UDP-N-acetylglucosamine 4,6-dehydratase (inverting) [Fimbriimonadaceae bacterium]|nr:UDP-N-acetylglucosamine 4,6-dehydratase (inverting) [Fimbriimonadaceae bacterium]
MGFYDGKTVLVTGGTGSFGKAFLNRILNSTDVRKVIVFSRDELKQFELQQVLQGDSRLRYFLGDVRDYERLYRAFDGVDYVVHAAALKQVPAAEYNPFEAVKTNINGAQNIIEAAINQGVERVIALSTDKACSPLNLYGATKLVSDKLFINGNAYVGKHRTRFAVVRYGNVVGSRGSVVPLFKRLRENGVLPITDERMTRFWITLPQGVQFVLDSLERMHGGELFVPKIPSMKVTDLAKAMAPEARLEFIGIRPGEKIHEEMISVNDARSTVDMGKYYVVQPEMEWWAKEELKGSKLPEGFSYSSDSNDDWLSVEQLRDMIADV